jgi:hypothetical protein
MVSVCIQVLLELSDVELEVGLGITHPMHRKKLRLAIEEHRHPALVRYPCIAQLGHTWVSSEWLPDLGLAQASAMLHGYFKIITCLGLRICTVMPRVLAMCIPFISEKLLSFVNVWNTWTPPWFRIHMQLFIIILLLVVNGILPYVFFHLRSSFLEVFQVEVKYVKDT